MVGEKGRERGSKKVGRAVEERRCVEEGIAAGEERVDGSVRCRGEKRYWGSSVRVEWGRRSEVDSDRLTREVLNEVEMAEATLDAAVPVPGLER